MQIGLNTDSLATLSFDEALDVAAAVGIETIELSTGNWSNAPHADLDTLISSAAARRELK